MRRFFAVIFLLLCALAANATDYFVAASGGNDTFNGLTLGTAWATIQKAANTVVAGDVVRVQAGTYNERVAEGTGGTPTSPIIYVADGHTNVICRGFNVTGDNVWVIGFEITHTSLVNYPPILWFGATNGVVSDCYIHHTDLNGGDSVIQPNGQSHRFIFRFNDVSWTGSIDGVNMSPSSDLWRCVGPTGWATNHLYEFNRIHETGDYFVPGWTNAIVQGNILGPTTTAFALGAPHVDGIQCDLESKYVIFRNNWHVDNVIADAHFILLEVPSNPSPAHSKHIVGVKCVSLRSGDQLWYQMRDATNLLNGHNTVGQVGGGRGGPASSGFIRVFANGQNPSFNNESYNNIFTNVTTLTCYLIEPGGGSLAHSHDCIFPACNDIVNGVNGDLETNPKFVNYAVNNVMLASDSPCIDAGGPLTTVTNSGSGTTFGVPNPYWFTDGMGLTVGDTIYVGNDNGLVITAIDFSTFRITVNQSFTWSSGEGVGYVYRGSGPDMGAYEFGDTLLTAATYTQSGNDFTVTATGDAYQTVAYKDWVPVEIKYGQGPHTFTIVGGTTNIFKVCPAHAQATPWLKATFAGGGGGGGGPSKYGNKGRAAKVGSVIP